MVLSPFVLALTVFGLFRQACSDSQLYLNISVMPRSPVSSYNQKEASVRSLKIEPFYMMDLEEKIDSFVNSDQKEIMQKLISDAVAFFKKALKLTTPVKKSGILLSRTCEYTTGKGTIYASADPPISACPSRCGFRTFCGPRIEIPTNMLADCTEQFFENQILTLELYDDNPNEEPQPVDADFILFVDTMERPESRFVVVEHAFCQLDLVTYRPIAGYLTFNSLSLRLGGGVDYELMLAQVKHSLCHLLGFSLNAMGLSPTLNNLSYKDYPETNEERLPWERLNNDLGVFSPAEKVFSIKNEESQRRFFLSAPKTVQFVQKHFNCLTLTYVELENQKEDAKSNTAANHWEQRLFPEELMSMSIFDSTLSAFGPKLSNLTLSFFEDLGWYTPDYSIAEPLTFGVNSGCDFAMIRNCKELISSFPFSFCSPDNFLGENSGKCDRSLNSWMKCTFESYQSESVDVPVSENPQVGGPFYSDYCPQFREYSTCQSNDELSPSKCMALERRSSHCDGSFSDKDDMCRRVVCSGHSYGVPDLNLTCSHRGQEITLTDGSLCSYSYTCPPCEAMCDNCTGFGGRDSHLQQSYSQRFFENLNVYFYAFCTISMILLF